jgi:hypothetical protein
MMPTEVAVTVPLVPELVRGIDGWGIPLEPGPIAVVVAGVGIIPIPGLVELALGNNPPISLTTEPSRPPLLVVVGIPVEDTTGTLTGMVEDPVAEVVVSPEGMTMPRLSRRLPWEEVVEVAVEESVAVAVVLELVVVIPRRFETSEPTAPRRESLLLVVVAAPEVAVLGVVLLALVVVVEEVELLDPRPRRLETSPRRESLVVVVVALVLVLVVAGGLEAARYSVEVVRV